MCQHVAAQRVGMGSFAQAKMKERAEKTVLLQKRWLNDGLASFVLACAFPSYIPAHAFYAMLMSACMSLYEVL